MSEEQLAERLASIEAKLDDIGSEIAVIRRFRQDMDDLKKDLTPVVNDVFQTTVEEMEELSPFVRGGDMIHLLKKILRNTNNINRIFTQLEAAVEFVDDVQPLGKEVFDDVLIKLNELDRKGYFAFSRELARVADNVVTHFTPDDVRLLADNIVVILETVRDLTQPEMLKALDNAVNIYKRLDTKEIEEYSLWRVIREVNSPEMRRAWGLFYTFLKNLSQEYAPSEAKAS